MAPRIERIWGTILGQTAIRRKDSPERDSMASRDDDENKRQDTAQQEPEQEDTKNAIANEIDRETLEKAAAELRASGHFAQTGMQIEVANSPTGLTVRFSLPTGVFVKALSADEFMKLKSNSSPDEAPRGKILDQKF